MASLRDLLAAGIGQPLNSGVRTSARGLSWSERRRVQKLVRRGEVSWDERSARYAVEVARVIERTPSFLSPAVSRWLLWALAVGSALLAIGTWADAGLSVSALVYTAGSVVLTVVASRSPAWLKNATRARQANVALLRSSGAPEVTQAEQPQWSRREERAGFFLAVLFAAALFGGQTFFAEDHDFVGAVVGGLIFGLLFVPIMRAMSRRAHANGPGATPPTPIGLELWEHVPARVRGAVRGTVTAVGLFCLWVLVVGPTDLSTCDTSEGGLPVADQVGFTRAFCGTPGAALADTMIVYALVGAVPLFGLLLGVFGAVWRSGVVRLRLLISSVALVTLPVGLAWLLAGAH